MATGKKVLFTLTAVFIAAIAALSLAQNVSPKAFAETEYGAYYSENVQAVKASGVDPDSYFDECHTQEAEDGFEAEVNFAKMKSIVYAATTSGKVDQLLARETPLIEAGDLKQAQDLVAAAKADLVITATDINAPYWASGAASGYNALCQDADKVLNDLQAKLELIKSDAVADFTTYRTEAINAVNDKYKSIVGFSLDNPEVKENENLSACGKTQLTAITAVKDEYAKDEGKIAAVAYDAGKVAEARANIDKLKNEAIAKLEVLPRNSFDNAYILYMDWLNVVTGDKNASGYESAVTAAVNAAKVPCEKAITEFYNGATAVVKNNYDAKFKNLKDFLDGLESEPLYTPVRLSSLSSTNGAIVITARYADGTAAEVLPENCTLWIWDSPNGSAKRNATSDIKNYDKNLSAAYFMFLNVYKGSKPYSVPSKDSDGKAVTYEVKVNLASYYGSYGKNGADRSANIDKALSYINLLGAKDGVSMCYSYENGKVAALEYTIENGVVRFKTKTFGSFCIAGVGLDNIFAEPLFWLIVLVIVILLILLLKTLRKHSKFSIKFVTNGGNKIDNLRVCRGECIVLPEQPVKEGFVFAGWFSDKELNNRFLDTQLNKRKGMKLYAKWVSPVTRERLDEFYDILRAQMLSYEKVGFKPSMGITDKELIANMYQEGNAVILNLAYDPEKLKKEGFSVDVAKDKKFEEVPARKYIACESAFSEALALTEKVFASKGLQKKSDAESVPVSTDEERKQGFVYYVQNERVASTAEDYFELLRINLKSYVMEKDPGTFKPGDKLTLARIYITNEVACLHLPLVKKEKELAKPSRNSQFEDTPVVFQILTGGDLLEAYDLIAEVMEANGFVKCPENSNDLKDVQVPTTNGFAYTLKF